MDERALAVDWNCDAEERTTASFSEEERVGGVGGTVGRKRSGCFSSARGEVSLLVV